MQQLFGTILFLLSLAVAPVDVFAQPNLSDQLDRRDRREPAIVLNTGGRTGTCDVLQFTPDGRELLAAGDDKCVTAYRLIDNGLDNRHVRFLRWPSWREQRGSIYAMDISPDGKRVAIGGYGMHNTDVAVLDRESGNVLHLANLDADSVNMFAVMSVSFSPSGREIAVGTGNGFVCLWDFEHAPVRLGQHRLSEGSQFNRVRAMQFFGEDYLLSIAESGSWLVWKRQNGQWRAEPPTNVPNRNGFRAVAVNRPSGLIAGGELGSAIQLLSIYDGPRPPIQLGDGEFPRSLTFAPDGKKLAVGIGRMKPGDGFRLEGDESIRIFDLSANPPTQTMSLAHTGRVEALAWRGDRLAGAGGDNHEVKLWDLTKPNKPISEARGAGSGIWGVAFASSESGRYLAFADRRDSSASHPNRRGAGEMRYFDLLRRRFEKSVPATVKQTKPLDEFEGWSIKADETVPWKWWVIDPNHTPHPLPWDFDQDGRPTCYTFLKPSEGHAWRLAVGHYWGFSLFEMAGPELRRTRLYTGHQGEVTSIAPSADWTSVVTASSDQTIAAWSLNDWPSKTALGAAFTPGSDSIKVQSVDVGSPAWEMGLIPGDEIVKLAVGGSIYFVSGSMRTPLEAKRALDNPALGRELFVSIRRAGRDKPFETLTTLRTRPLWRFLPWSDREWVIWTWNGSYYDTSTNGDSRVGWLMNDASLSKTPRFYPLEYFHDQFWKPEVIDELLDSRDIAKALEIALGRNPKPIRLGMNEPPDVRIELSADIANGPVTAQLAATPRGDNIDFQPQRVELWINDFRLPPWEPKGRPFTTTFEIRPEMLRAGPNRLTLQSFNRLGGRSEVTRTLTKPQKPQSPNLLGLAVGINDYSASVSNDGKRGALGKLEGAINDVTMEAERWSSQKGKLFANVDLNVCADQKATRDQLLAEFDRLAKAARPDDLMLVFLCGHGDFRELNSSKENKSQKRFFFCCPNYDATHPNQTGIDNVTLFEKLAAIPCRKVVFLDACHSGDAATSISTVRNLIPAGQGPIVFAACDRSESAYEDKTLHHGLFTLAILKALGDGFADADRDGDGKLDPQELMNAIRRYLPQLLRDTGRAEDLQNPQFFPPQPESFPLYQR